MGLLFCSCFEKKFFRKPTTDGSWLPTTSKDPTKLEYFEINATFSMKTGYRAVDQVVWNQVKIITFI